jgi:hypothetical protein
MHEVDHIYEQLNQQDEYDNVATKMGSDLQGRNSQSHPSLQHAVSTVVT